jgi:hypothetical protein
MHAGLLLLLLLPPPLFFFDPRSHFPATLQPSHQTRDAFAAHFQPHTVRAITCIGNLKRIKIRLLLRVLIIIIIKMAPADLFPPP